MSKIKRIRRWLRRKLWRKQRVDSRSRSGMTMRGPGMTIQSGKSGGKRKRRLRSVLILIQESRG